MSAEPVGSLAEEAAKLIAALQGWKQEPEDSADGPVRDGGDEHDPHSAECRFCPLCTAARLAKAATPEVRDHLSSAALSLAMAVKGLLDATAPSTPSSTQSTPVEKIDLAED
jgi:hypothetical protein